MLNIFKRRKQRAESPMVQLAQQAVVYAEDFEKKLDFSEASLNDLEAILAYYHDDRLISCPPDRQVWSMAMIFGAYLGETILRHGASDLGYRWVETEDEPILEKDHDWQLAPVSKVYKRLVNGAEDDIRSFYEMAFQIIRGRLPTE